MPQLTMTDHSVELARLKRRLEREHHARLEAEQIAENGLRELYEQQRRLQLLEAIAVKANQTSTLNDMLQFTLTQLCQFTHWPLGHAYVSLPKQCDRLYPTAIWHNYLTDEDAVEDFCRTTEMTFFDRGIGLPGRVLATGEAAWITDIAKDRDFVRQASAQQLGLKTAFAFPVLAGQHVAAVLEFFSTQEIQPDAELLHTMAQIGMQLGRVVERQMAEERLKHDAFHDSLTGLPNRTLFLDRLQHAMNYQKRHPKYLFAVLFVDLDRFKVVNDSLGHLAGDQLLSQIVPRLLTTLRSEDTVARIGETRDIKDTLARLGGDEFTLLLDDIHSPNDAMRVAERIQHTLTTLPFSINEQAVYASASIGIATADQQTSAEDLLRNANLAMYRAKSLGGACCELFDQSMHVRAVNRLIIENDLRRALVDNHFILHYQPIVSFKTGAIVGFEALVRWQKNATTLIYPNDFIYIAEDTGLILLLDMWVLQQACRTMRQWQIDFPQQQPLTISVNLSARLFAQNNLVEQVQAIINATGINPASVRLEITESMTMGDAERSVQILSRLKEIGVHLSIDDFGTGYSSLSYLHRFPADILKIDRSFISRMDDSPECFQIIQSIMNLARNLGMDVIAEGPETAAHVQQLQALDCDFGQGYFFSRPVDEQKATALLHGACVYSMLTKDTVIPSLSA